MNAKNIWLRTDIFSLVLSTCIGISGLGSFADQVFVLVELVEFIEAAILLLLLQYVNISRNK